MQCDHTLPSASHERRTIHAANADTEEKGPGDLPVPVERRKA